MCRHFTMLAKKIPSVIFLNFILLTYASGFDRRLSFLPWRNFLSLGVSFLGQKRAVGKCGDYFCQRIFPKVFSFEHFRCLPIEEENIFLWGLPFAPPYLRIYEGIFHWTKVMAISVTLEFFLSVGWLWPPQMSGYVKGLFFGTTKYGKTRLGDSRKHHLNRFQKFFLKLGLQKGGWNSELVKGLSKKFLSQGWLYPLLTSE